MSLPEGSTAAAPPPKPRRALALDALRGIAILMMCYSGVVAGIQELPTWMRHAQYPRPWNFDPSVPGFTWVDWVFPMFLFAMGAAFPLAMARKLDSGTPKRKLLIGALLRALALVFFAVYVDNVQPWKMGADPLRLLFGSGIDAPVGDGVWNRTTTQTWITAFLGFAFLFPVFTRLPREWPKKVQLGVRLAGWALCICLLLVLRFPDGGGYSVRRYDIIIMVLANMALFGAAVWIFTRHSMFLRLATLPVVYALLKAHTSSGSWIATWTKSSYALGEGALAESRFFLSEWFITASNGTLYFDFGWMVQFGWLKYLLIVVPGTIAGDWLLRWMKESAAEGHSRERPTEGAWTRGRYLGFSLGLTALIIFVHTGLQARGAWLPVTSWLTIAVAIGGWFLVRDAQSPSERFLRALYQGGMYALVLGLIFEPTEGGIKKDPSNMSYYFVSGGLSFLALAALTVWIDIFNWKRPFGLLVANGQNPMIAYIGIRNLLGPIVELRYLPFAAGDATWTSARGWVAGLVNAWKDAGLGGKTAAWILAAWGFLQTLLLAVLVWVFTRMRIFWRT